MLSDNEKFAKLMSKNFVATLSSYTRAGYPHMVPLWIVDHQDKVYFSTYDHSVKLKNLIRNNKIGLSIVHPSGMPYFSLYGDAIIKKQVDLSDYQEIVTKIVKKYMSQDQFVDGIDERMNNPSRVLVEISPLKIFPR